MQNKRSLGEIIKLKQNNTPNQELLNNLQYEILHFKPGRELEIEFEVYKDVMREKEMNLLI